MNRIAISALATVAVLGSSAGIGVAWAESHHHDGSHADRHGTAVAFGPTSYDGLRLGMDVHEIRAAGGTTREPRPEVCTTVTLPSHGGDKHASDGLVSKKAGLAYVVTTDPRATTPEGIHVGSTRAEAEAAYPHAEKAPDFWIAPVPGHRGVSYMWGYRHGRVSGLSMELDTQDCAG